MVQGWQCAKHDGKASRVEDILEEQTDFRILGSNNKSGVNNAGRGIVEF